jgi:hypothetical protein
LLAEPILSENLNLRCPRLGSPGSGLASEFLEFLQQVGGVRCQEQGEVGEKCEIVAGQDFEVILIGKFEFEVPSFGISWIWFGQRISGIPSAGRWSRVPGTRGSW